MSEVDILIGAQWGDEGKGKWVDILSEHKDIVARFQGGNNAGHTLYIDGKKVVLHQLPSGIFRDGKISALLSGVVINPTQLASEIAFVSKDIKINHENLWISDKSHVVTPFNIYDDEVSENLSQSPIGTTKRGIGPTYRDKVNRSGLRMHSYIDDHLRHEWVQSQIQSCEEFEKHYKEHQDIWNEFHAAAAAIKPFVMNAESRIRQALKANKSLLLEGAQGTLLDVSHGTYPYVTSSTTVSSGALTSLGISPKKITNILGVAKAYTTRVGEGPFPTELHNDHGRLLAEKGHEFGATTNRPRRCGWFDAVAMKYACEINGLDYILLNKIDILDGFETLKIATSYKHPTLGQIDEFPSDHKILKECEPVYETLEGWEGQIPDEADYDSLPKELKAYCNRIEQLCETKINLIGTGPYRDNYIQKH